MNQIFKILDDNFYYFQKIRRNIHMYPELSNVEFDTSRFIESILLENGVSDIIRLGDTSLLALFKSTIETKDTILFRADMDAILLQEENNNNDYVSKKAGIMHACGHDVHCATLLSLVPVFKKCNFTKNVGLLFQQGEESIVSGAKKIITLIPFDINITEIYGFHVWSEINLGEVIVKKGVLMGSVDGISIKLIFKDANIDPLIIFSKFIQEIRNIIPNDKIEENAKASLSLGEIKGGIAPNKFIQEIILNGTLRSVCDREKKQLLINIDKSKSAMEYMYNMSIEVSYTPNIRPILENNEKCVSQLDYACSQVEELSIVDMNSYANCSEDFGFYLQHYNGAYILIGSRSSEDTAHPLHDSKFNVDERVILYGAKIFVQLLLNKNILHYDVI